MAASLLPDLGKVCRIEISGRLHKREFDAVQGPVSERIQRAGPIRLLIELVDFQGWAADGNWSDIGFFVRYGNDIERIAIVGDERWRDEALMFASADLRSGDVEFFPSGDLAHAVAWVTKDGPPEGGAPQSGLNGRR